MTPTRLETWFRDYEDVLLAGIVLVGVLLRVLLAANAPTPAGYVWDPYALGIQVLHENGRLPVAEDCWQCYHPPVFYLAGWPLYALGRWLGGAPDHGAVQWATLLAPISGAVVVYFGFRLLRLFRCRGAALVAGVAVLLSFPCLFISSYGLEADILLAAILSGFVYYLTRAAARPRQRVPTDAVILGALSGLAAGTKYSGLAGLATAGIVYGWRTIAGPDRRFAARDGAVILAITLAIGGWKYAENYLERGTPMFANGSASGGFSLTGRQSVSVHEFTSLRLGDLWDLLHSPNTHLVLTRFPVYRSVPTTLHAQAWTDMTYFSLQSRRAELKPPFIEPKRIPVKLVIAVLVLGVVPEALALVGLIVSLGHRLLRPMTAMLAVSLAAYAWWFVTQPEWGLKTKYLLFLVPAFALYVVIGLAWLRRRLPRPVFYLAAVALIVQLAVTHVYLLAFAQGDI